MSTLPYNSQNKIMFLKYNPFNDLIYMLYKICNFTNKNIFDLLLIENSIAMKVSTLSNFSRRRSFKK